MPTSALRTLTYLARLTFGRATAYISFAIVQLVRRNMVVMLEMIAEVRRTDSNSCRPVGPHWFVGYAKPRPHGRGYYIAALRASEKSA
jgi:hypothetical protein